jgi:AraC-like DNA-binding protein
MPQNLKPATSTATRQDGKAGFGLFRREALTSGPAGSVHHLFADLRCVNRCEIIGEDLRRDMQGARLMINGSMGHGSWELYRLGHDLYVIAGDVVCDAAPRVETLLGEGLVEFHLRLAGVLTLTIPNFREPVTVTGPCMLVLHQPPGINVTEQVVPQRRDTGMSLFCRPKYLAELAQRNGIEPWGGLDEIERLGPRSVWHQQVPLSPTLLHIANSLLRSPYRGGFRMLHAEAKALELLCEVLSVATARPQESQLGTSETAARQLDLARHILASKPSSSPRTRDVARMIGMSESTLKRGFKTRFGVTVFDYGTECRMRYALELLRCRRMSVGQVADAVGYQHQTSFTAAFQQHFGFLPNQARKSMH